MYIDENLIRILTPHKGETIDVSYAISLIKTIAKEHEQKQLLLHNVVVPKGTLCKCKKEFIVYNDREGLNVCTLCGESKLA
jgi:hypothetical protein